MIGLKTVDSMLRGYVFTIDTIFAIFVFISLAMAIATSVTKKDKSVEMLLLYKQADDILIAMDKSNVLSRLQKEEISNILNKSFENDVFWAMKIDYYKNDSTLQHDGTLTFSKNNIKSPGKNAIVAKRIFVIIRDKEVANFGLVELTAWREE